MRWLLSIWKIRREPPPARELPVLLLKAMIFGSLFGPLMGISLTAIFDPRSLTVFRGPVLFFWSPLEGIIWSLTFFILCGLGNAWLRPLLNGYPPSIIGTVHVIYNSIACSFGFAFVWGILAHFPPPMRVEIPYFWRIVLLDGILGAVLALVIGAFVKLKLQVERTQAELREKEVQQTRLAGETARAQALALQSQINPHFFFNTLNTISALVEIDPPAAQRTIGRLSDMFRYTLGCTHSGPVTLEQEVQFVRDYLSIEQARFQRRLRVELPETGLTSLFVPGLVLQPLVENAVKYGIAERLDGGTVSVRVERKGNAARISVRNTSTGHSDLAQANLFQPGHALDNVRARLRLFTGKTDPLTFRSDADWVEFSFDLESAAAPERAKS
jgi:signal transduction histidine kinase